MRRSKDQTQTDARCLPRVRASSALAILTGFAAACGVPAISDVSPEDVTSDTATPDAGGNRWGGSTGDAGTADAQGNSSAGSDASCTDSGSGNAPDAMDSASCSIGQCPPTTLVTTRQPIGLAVNETTVYWETGVGNLMSASVAGADVSTLFSGAIDAGESPVLVDSSLNDLIVNSTSAYFIVNAGNSNYVQAALLDGTGASTLDLDTNIANSEQAIALDSTALYVARFNIDSQGGSCPDLGIDVVPLNGDKTTTVSGACSLVRLTVDSSQNLYWTDRGRPPGTVNPSVMMQSVSAATPTKIASAVSPRGIAVYGGKVYWSDSGNIMVQSIGATSASVLSSSADPQDIVVDASGVYWIDSGSAVMMASLSGGAATTIAQGQTNVVALATNSSSVFWADEGTFADDNVDGAVMRVAK